MPGLYTVMILHCAIAPITSSAAFAAIMGLDVAFSLVALILCNVLSPLTTAGYRALLPVFLPQGTGEGAGDEERRRDEMEKLRSLGYVQ
jgi:hypothetical protein